MKLEDKVITGLATSDDDVAITLDIDEEKVVDLFENIANKNISMDMISQTAPMNSKITVSFTILVTSFVSNPLTSMLATIIGNISGFIFITIGD